MPTFVATVLGVITLLVLTPATYKIQGYDAYDAMLRSDNFIPLETPKGVIVEPTIAELIRRKAEEYGTNPDLLTEIVRRESNFDPSVCNHEFGCNAGQGLVQLIPSTLQWCEKIFERDMDAFDPIDNLDCGAYLLGKDGIRHWEGDGTWGSGPYDLSKY